MAPTAVLSVVLSRHPPANGIAIVNSILAVKASSATILLKPSFASATLEPVAGMELAAAITVVGVLPYQAWASESHAIEETAGCGR